MQGRGPGVLLILAGLTILLGVSGFLWIAAQQANEGPCTSTGSQKAASGTLEAPAIDRATMRWCYRTPTSNTSLILNPPLVADGLVLVDIPASGGGGLHAVDTATGAVRWKVQGNLDRLRHYRDKVIALDFTHEEVVALELANGRERWRTSVPGAALAWDLIVFDHLVYVTSAATGQGRDPAMGVTALDGDTGKVRWRQTAPGGRVSLEPSGNILVVAADDGTTLQDRAVLVVAIDASPGTERWRQEMRSDWISPIVTADGLVILAQADMKLRALDVSTGAQRWEVKPPRPAQPAYFNVTTMGGTLYAEYQMVDHADDAQLVAIDPATGETLWVYHASGGWTAVVAAVGDKLICRDGPALGVLDAASGAPLWRLNPVHRFLHSHNYSEVVVVGNTLYATATDGFAYALDLATGNERWRIGIGGSMNDRGPDGVLGSGNTVYVWFGPWLYAFAAG